MCKNFRIYNKKAITSKEGDYLMDHSVFIYLLDQSGNFVDVFSRNNTVDECVEKIKQFAIKQPM